MDRGVTDKGVMDRARPSRRSASIRSVVVAVAAGESQKPAAAQAAPTFRCRPNRGAICHGAS